MPLAYNHFSRDPAPVPAPAAPKPITMAWPAAAAAAGAAPVVSSGRGCTCGGGVKSVFRSTHPNHVTEHRNNDNNHFTTECCCSRSAPGPVPASGAGQLSVSSGARVTPPNSHHRYAHPSTSSSSSSPSPPQSHSNNCCSSHPSRSPRLAGSSTPSNHCMQCCCCVKHVDNVHRHNEQVPGVKFGRSSPIPKTSARNSNKLKSSSNTAENDCCCHHCCHSCTAAQEADLIVEVATQTEPSQVYVTDALAQKPAALQGLNGEGSQPVVAGKSHSQKGSQSQALCSAVIKELKAEAQRHRSECDKTVSDRSAHKHIGQLKSPRTAEASALEARLAKERHAQIEALLIAKATKEKELLRTRQKMVSKIDRLKASVADVDAKMADLNGQIKACIDAVNAEYDRSLRDAQLGQTK